MCGISGYIGIGDRRDLAAMARRMVHRGPDDEGIWQADSPRTRVGLAFRRLIVVDPEGGTQPMLDRTDDIAVVFNGEIYNHREMRTRLVERGHRFRSDHSDTEVLLHGYREWGENIVEHLRGMFAFAIWDKARQRLVAAVDPFGKKPFYYAAVPGGFVFASEIHALASHRGVPVEINRAALARYFGFGFVPQPETLLAGVAKLGAGRLLRYEADSGRLQVRRYWKFAIDGTPSPAGPSARRQDLRATIEQAVARRLEADVPLGFLLSGGLDSAVVAATARRLLPDSQIQCFTLGFEEPSYDETAAARATAAALGIEHHVETFSLLRLAEFADGVLRGMDEPLADASLLPTALLCRFVRQYVNVALSGDGADEMFAGYDTFAALPLAEAYSAVVPEPLHRGLRSLAERVPPSDRNLSFGFKLRRALRGLSHPEALWHPVWLAPANVEELSHLFGGAVSGEEVYRPALEHWEGSRASYRRDRALEYYVDFYLQSNILPKIDRASMQFSLEVRSPYLDMDLAAFCAGLPYSDKHARGVRKRLLREVAAEILPAEVLQRGKKGFGMPISTWLRSMPRPRLDRALSLGLNAGMLDRAWAEHANRQRDHRGLLWAWVCLDRWQETMTELVAARSQAA